MGKVFDAAEVAKHNSAESCWVIIHDKVYDVTNFMTDHPGGSKVILRLAGKDATEEFDPVHPDGTLEENLKPEACLGTVDPSTMPQPEPQTSTQSKIEEIPVQNLLNMDEFEKAATAKISKKAWAYYYSAADDLITKRFNTEVFRSILLRPRVFIDCTECDITARLLDNPVSMPIYVSPAAMARLGHPSGEAGIAEACRSFGAMQIISNSASMTPEQIVAGASPEQTFGWQLYVQEERSRSEKMIERINKLPAIKFLVLTLDTPVMGKREDDLRGGNVINEITEIKSPEVSQKDERAVFQGLDPTLNWKETLKWITKHTKLPVVLKGLQTHEDAYIASLHAPQIKGIILSNHGGRSLDTSPPAFLIRLRFWLMGGIRRGTDVVKALCLGARGVGIGRPALWGLSAGGVDGVKRTLQILADETKTCMRLLGVERLDQLGMQHINTRMVEQQIYDGPSGLDPIRAEFRSKL
ncbi:hypothetical protein N7526_008079 [Penicillium atrosanguineum]|nr:hypothetical protein N7526_008079 [Penicillium atrosanguineum]